MIGPGSDKKSSSQLLTGSKCLPTKLLGLSWPKSPHLHPYQEVQLNPHGGHPQLCWHTGLQCTLHKILKKTNRESEFLEQKYTLDRSMCPITQNDWSVLASNLTTSSGPPTPNHPLGPPIVWRLSPGQIIFLFGRQWHWALLRISKVDFFVIYTIQMIRQITSFFGVRAG